MQKISNMPPSGALEQDVEALRQLLVQLRRLAPVRDPVAMASEQRDLTPPQLHALLSLGHDDGLSMGELSRRGGVSEKTMTGVVDRLEQAQLVRRERDLHDRRMVRVCLTGHGRTLFAECDRQLTGGLRRFLTLVDAEDRAALLRLLSKLNQRLAALLPAACEERK